MTRRRFGIVLLILLALVVLGRASALVEHEDELDRLARAYAATQTAAAPTPRS